MNPSPSRAQRWRDFVEAFWAADAMLIGLVLFFGLVGGALFESPGLAIGLGVAALLLAAHSLLRRRHADEITTAPFSRRVRERRGF